MRVDAATGGIPANDEMVEMATGGDAGRAVIGFFSG
jgi:hypothetical protein